MTESILIGAQDGGTSAQHLNLKYANRHGMISGATGTGKTVSLQILAEQLSDAGIPVFAADVKGDLSGIAAAGVSKPFLEKRAQQLALSDYGYRAYPTLFWDLHGKKGHQLRTTVTEMGPLLLARLLDLNDTQEGVLAIAFRLADDQGLLLLDLKDLRALLTHMAEQGSELRAAYGHFTTASIGAIQRRLLQLEDQGAGRFFGEPALTVKDFIRTDRDGRGVINILAADRLMQTPKTYAMFLVWLMAELFEELPEVGDLDRPKLVFFFDEAHLLFRNAPKALLERVETVARLIRSKGVGIYFVTQDPGDVPNTVAGQLGNRIQHALRAFTPQQQKRVKAAAQSFRPNPAFDAQAVIGELGVGEALVSFLERKGVPTMVERVLIRPPHSRLGPLKAAERKALMAESPIGSHYDESVDRASAFERLAERATKAAEAEAKSTPAKKKTRSRSSSRQGVGETFIKSFARQIGRTLSRELVRGLLGSMKRR